MHFPRLLMFYTKECEHFYPGPFPVRCHFRVISTVSYSLACVTTVGFTQTVQVGSFVSSNLRSEQRVVVTL